MPYMFPLIALVLVLIISAAGVVGIRRRLRLDLRDELNAAVIQPSGALVYFAHSKLDYASERARAALSVIHARRPGARVVDPENFVHWPQLVKQYGSTDALYAAIIDLCDEVIALEHAGYVGRGVYCELDCAGIRAIPRWVVRGRQLVAVTGLQMVDVTDMKLRFGRVEPAEPIPFTCER